ALNQIHRLAKYRGLSESIVASLVEKHTEPRQFGIFGDPVINVVKLNMALDELNTR
ncbi:MAG: potassium-transporting ATPase subunit C, partial [Nitrospirae bacterium]|nr:potassium-transporting ATPase subunit C [Nitrospirota bacterium]